MSIIFDTTQIQCLDCNQEFDTEHGAKSKTDTAECPVNRSEMGIAMGATRGADRKTSSLDVREPLYTPAQRKRRDETVWTLVQGLLAPAQFIIFLISLGLVLRFMATGEGLAIAHASIVLKTMVLYAIMITGAIWEKEVFGQYLFADAFYWEDVFSMLVLALHSAYLIALFTNTGDAMVLMWLALAAYAAYTINAAQFLLKLRAARLDAQDTQLLSDGAA